MTASEQRRKGRKDDKKFMDVHELSLRLLATLLGCRWATSAPAPKQMHNETAPHSQASTQVQERDTQLRECQPASSGRTAGPSFRWEHLAPLLHRYLGEQLMHAEQEEDDDASVCVDPPMAGMSQRELPGSSKEEETSSASRKHAASADALLIPVRRSLLSLCIQRDARIAPYFVIHSRQWTNILHQRGGKEGLECFPSSLCLAEVDIRCSDASDLAAQHDGPFSAMPECVRPLPLEHLVPLNNNQDRYVLLRRCENDVWNAHLCQLQEALFPMIADNESRATFLTLLASMKPDEDVPEAVRAGTIATTGGTPGATDAAAARFSQARMLILNPALVYGAVRAHVLDTVRSLDADDDTCDVGVHAAMDRATVEQLFWGMGVKNQRPWKLFAAACPDVAALISARAVSTKSGVRKHRAALTRESPRADHLQPPSPSVVTDCVDRRTNIHTSEGSIHVAKMPVTAAAAPRGDVGDMVRSLKQLALEMLQVACRLEQAIDEQYLTTSN